MTDRRPDPRLDLSKGIPMPEVIDRLGITGLRRAGSEMVGPCPVCGGTDRFAISLRTHAHNCRKCGIKGGDQVALVMSVQGLGFKPALAWLTGEDTPPEDPAEIARRRKAAARREAQEAADRARFREAAIRRGLSIWNAAEPGQHPLLLDYLEGRGLPGDILGRVARDALRLHPALPMLRRIGGARVELHRGPAMVARIMGARRDFIGAHVTWIDPARPGAKARITTRIEDNKGEPWPAKLIQGTTKGGAICLTAARSDTLVMGEGIETTLTALASGALAGADHWAGVSLGNMGGRMQHIPGRRHSGQPDMSDAEAFLPPPWVRRLVFIQDGDSDPKATRARLEAGLIRAMETRPGLRGQIVEAPEGQDLNDLVKPADPVGNDDGGVDG